MITRISTRPCIYFYLSLCASIPYSTSMSTVVNLTVVAGISGVTVTLVTILPWHAFTMHHAWLVMAEIHGGDCTWSYTTVKSARTTWKFRRKICHAICYLYHKSHIRSHIRVVWEFTQEPTKYTWFSLWKLCSDPRIYSLVLDFSSTEILFCGSIARFRL